jgi:hypothetical protein
MREILAVVSWILASNLSKCMISFSIKKNHLASLLAIPLVSLVEEIEIDGQPIMAYLGY